MKFTETYPVVLFAGVAESSRGKFFAGVARACFRTDAIVIDSGTVSGMETYALRRGRETI